MDKHPGAPQRGHVEFPQWGSVHRASFPALSLGSHLLGAHFLPHCLLASDAEVRPGQSMGRGTAEGVPRARWGSERRSPRVPGAPPALYLGLASSCSQTLRHQHRSLSSSPCPATHTAALQGSVDPELNPRLVFSASHLCDLEHSHLISPIK